jgi:predicted RNA-binding protein with PUA-like domain
MKLWILKSEPSTYSFDDLVKAGKTSWDGVRNYQARNNIRAMKPGDQAVVYHSGDEKAAVGLARILGVAYQDPGTQEDWSAIDIEAAQAFKQPVSLAQMKKDAVLKNMALVKNSRLSVSPLTEKEYQRLLELAGG